MSVRARVILVGSGEFNSYFVTAGQVCIVDLGIGNLEGRLILNIEDKLGLTKLRLAPVPASQCMFLGIQINAIPVLEDLAQAL